MKFRWGSYIDLTSFFQRKNFFLMNGYSLSLSLSLSLTLLYSTLVLWSNATLQIGRCRECPEGFILKSLWEHHADLVSKYWFTIFDPSQTTSFFKGLIHNFHSWSDFSSLMVMISQLVGVYSTAMLDLVISLYWRSTEEKASHLCFINTSVKQSRLMECYQKLLLTWIMTLVSVS